MCDRETEWQARAIRTLCGSDTTSDNSTQSQGTVPTCLGSTFSRKKTQEMLYRNSSNIKEDNKMIFIAGREFFYNVCSGGRIEK